MNRVGDDKGSVRALGAVASCDVCVNARSKTSIEVVAAGASRRHVRHSGPVEGAASPPIVQVPSSQHAILTTQWQPRRPPPAVASGSTAATSTSATTRAAENRLERSIEGGL